MKVFCEHRHELHGAIVSADPDAEQGPAFRFLYAVQNPRLAVFQELFEDNPPLPVCRPDTEEDLMQQCQAWPQWQFSVSVGSYCSHSQLPPHSDEEELFVLEDAYFTESMRIACNGMWRTMDAVLEAFPHKHRHREPSEAGPAAKVRATAPDVDLQAHLWLEQYMTTQAQRPSRPAASQQRSASSSTPLPSEPLSEEALQEVWQELASKRHEWRESTTLLDRDFVVEVRGGTWTAAHKKVAVDAISASTRTEMGRRWVELYGENKMASFSTLKYGEATAGLMAHEWAKRRQHFLDIWISQGAGRYAYTQADRDSYLPSTEWQALVESLQPGSAESTRVLALESFAPSLPEDPASGSTS